MERPLSISQKPPETRPGTQVRPEGDADCVRQRPQSPVGPHEGTGSRKQTRQERADMPRVGLRTGSLV